MNKTCIIIVGPTAVGKTRFAIDLASRLQTSIISADSRQCFRELNIGVAKPSLAELEQVKHYFINSHSIHEEVNAALFEKLSLSWINEIFDRNDFALMVGGTGLYIKAFAEGMDDIPVSVPGIREEIISSYDKNGIDWLKEQIKLLDPLFNDQGEINNPQRMIRALEVKLSTGKSILSFRTLKKTARAFKIIKIGLELPRDQLYERINTRVDEMIRQGLIEEARELFPFKNLNALRTVGYTELFEYFEGRLNLDRAIELIRMNSRHYAKRQLTWLRRDSEIKWIDGTENVKFENLKI